MKRFNRLVSSVVLVCFIWNTAVQDYALALSPMPGSTQSGTQEAMYAAGQKLLATKEFGPGSGISARFNDYTPGQFIGDAPKVAGLEFVQTKYRDGTPQGWENNALLKMDISDLVEAFKYFRDKEALILSGDLEIVEGDFKLEKGEKGEIPICRIERDGLSFGYRLVIHKDFVRMWNDIKANDVWFQYTFPDGKVRTVSLAWAIFYRIAKHEMADIVSRDGKEKFTPKSHGHMEYAMPFFEWNDSFRVNEDETSANAIRGRYAIVNDALWMWFLGSYCFGPATQYSDVMFKDRALWFLGLYEGPNAEEWNRWAVEHNLPDEFPNLHDGEAREIAMSIARTVNERFYTNYSRYKEPISRPKEAAMAEDFARREPHITKVLPMTGESDNKRMLRQLDILAEDVKDGNTEAVATVRNIARAYKNTEMAAKACLILLEAKIDPGYMRGKLVELRPIVKDAALAAAIDVALAEGKASEAGRTSPYFIGMSMGGTKLYAVLYKRSDSGKPVAVDSASCTWKSAFSLKDAGDVADPAKVSPDAIVSKIADTIKALAAKNGIKIADLNNAGCTSPGPVDSDRGTLGWDWKTHNLPFSKYEFTLRLSKLLGTPYVEIRHDAHSGLEGEIGLGLLSEVDNGYYVIQGTGLGGSLSKKKKYSKAIPELTEPGHHVARSADGHYRFIQKRGTLHPYEVVNNPDPAKVHQITADKVAAIKKSENLKDNDFIWVKDGERDMEDTVSGGALLALLKDKTMLVSRCGGKTADYDKFNTPADISELSLNGTKAEKETAKRIIKYVGDEMGRALACLAAASYGTDWQIERFVIGSTVGEKLGIDSKGRMLKTPAGRDYYYEAIRGSMYMELVTRFEVSVEFARTMLSQVFRSTITQDERETAGFDRFGSPVNPEFRGADGQFLQRPGKSPEDLLWIIATYIKVGDIISAPKLYDLYAAHYQEFNFEAPAKKDSALRTIERDLFGADSSILANGFIRELPEKGPNGERQFVEFVRMPVSATDTIKKALPELQDAASFILDAVKEFGPEVSLGKAAGSAADNSKITITILSKNGDDNGIRLSVSKEDDHIRLQTDIRATSHSDQGDKVEWSLYTFSPAKDSAEAAKEVRAMIHGILATCRRWGVRNGVLEENVVVFQKKLNTYLDSRKEMNALLADPEKNWKDRAQDILDLKNKVSFALEELWMESEITAPSLVTSGGKAVLSGIKEGDIVCNHKTKKVFIFSEMMDTLVLREMGEVVVLKPLSLTGEQRKMRDGYVSKLRSSDRDFLGRIDALKGLKAMMESGILPKPFEVGDVFQHCHSTYSHSPGNTPSYIAWRGYVLGLKVTGIVDHDTVAGFKEFRQAAQILGLRNPTCGYEQRVMPKGTPFANMTTNSPGNKGETYVAFHASARDTNKMQEERVVPAKVKRFEKTAELINKIANLGLDYKKDIEPLTEKGNPTEKHVAEAIAKLIYDKFKKEITAGSWDGVILCVNKLISECCIDSGKGDMLDKVLVKSPKDYEKLKNITTFTFLVRDRVVTIAKQIPGYGPTEDEVIHDIQVYGDAQANGELIEYCYLGDLKKCEAEDRTVMSRAAKQAFVDNMEKTGTSLPEFIVEWWLNKDDAAMLHLWIAYQIYMGIDGVALMPNRDRPQEVEDVIKIVQEVADFMKTKMIIRFKHVANGMDVNTPDMPYEYFSYSNRPEFVDVSLAIVRHEDSNRLAIAAASQDAYAPVTDDKLKRSILGWFAEMANRSEADIIRDSDNYVVVCLGRVAKTYGLTFSGIAYYVLRKGDATIYALNTGRDLTEQGIDIVEQGSWSYDEKAIAFIRQLASSTTDTDWVAAAKKPKGSAQPLAAVAAARHAERHGELDGPEEAMSSSPYKANNRQTSEWIVRGIAHQSWGVERDAVKSIVDYLINEAGPREVSIIANELAGYNDERLASIFELLLKRLDGKGPRPRDPGLTRQLVSSVVESVKAYSATDLTMETINLTFIRPEFVPRGAKLSKIYGEVGNYVVCRYDITGKEGLHFIVIYDKTERVCPKWFTDKRDYPSEYRGQTEVRLYKDQNLVTIYNTERTGWDDNSGLSEDYVLCDTKAGKIVIEDGGASSYLGPKSFMVSTSTEYVLLLERGVNYNTRYVDRHQVGHEACANFSIYGLQARGAVHNISSFNFSRDLLSSLQEIKIIGGHYLLMEYLENARGSSLVMVYDIRDMLKTDAMPKPLLSSHCDKYSYDAAANILYAGGKALNLNTQSAVSPVGKSGELDNTPESVREMIGNAAPAAVSGDLPQPKIVQGQYNVWTLSDESGNEFKVTDFGANVISMKMSGRELLWHETNGQTVRQDNGLAVRGGMPFMFPWTSRIEGGLLTLADGRTVDLKKFPYVRKVPGASDIENVLHGMTDKIQWKAIDGEKDRIVLSARLRDVKIGVEGVGDLSEVFGDVEVRLTYRLMSGQFTSIVEVINLSNDKPAELSFGFHPFYRLGETLDGWSAQVQATEYWKTDSGQVPLKQEPLSVKRTEYDLRSPKALSRAYEVGLTGLYPGTDEEIVSRFSHKDGRTIEISQSQLYGNVMFWVPFGNPNLPAGIASIQPTTSSADAIKMSRAGIAEANPVHIAPGMTLFAAWTLSFSEPKAPNMRGDGTGFDTNRKVLQEDLGFAGAPLLSGKDLSQTAVELFGSVRAAEARGMMPSTDDLNTIVRDFEAGQLTGLEDKVIGLLTRISITATRGKNRGIATAAIKRYDARTGHQQAIAISDGRDNPPTEVFNMEKDLLLEMYGAVVLKSPAEVVVRANTIRVFRPYKEGMIFYLADMTTGIDYDVKEGAEGITFVRRQSRDPYFESAILTVSPGDDWAGRLLEISLTDPVIKDAALAAYEYISDGAPRLMVDESKGLVQINFADVRGGTILEIGRNKKPSGEFADDYFIKERDVINPAMGSIARHVKSSDLVHRVREYLAEQSWLLTSARLSDMKGLARGAFEDELGEDGAEPQAAKTKDGGSILRSEISSGSQAPMPFDAATQDERMEEIQRFVDKAMLSFSEREKYLLMLRNQGMSLAEIAKLPDINRSRDRIRQLVKRTEQRLWVRVIAMMERAGYSESDLAAFRYLIYNDKSRRAATAYFTSSADETAEIGKADVLAGASAAMPNKESAISIPEAIREYGAPVAGKFGPGLLEPSAAEIASFYPAINMLENERVEVYLPKDISDSLTRSVTEEIRRINIVIRDRIQKKTGHKAIEDPVKILPYNQSNLKNCLGRTGDNVRRIFVNDLLMTSEFRGIARNDIGILRGKRVITMAVPSGKDDAERTVNQAWLIKVSLLSALLDDRNSMTAVGVALRAELDGRVENPNGFVSNLAKSEDDSASTDAIRARVNYFLNTIVKLSPFIGEQLRILKAFWIAA